MRYSHRRSGHSSWCWPTRVEKWMNAPYPAPPTPFKHPRGVPLIVMGIAGFSLCPPLAPVTWVMASRTLKQLDRLAAAPDASVATNRRQVEVGWLCGIVGTALLVMRLILALTTG